MTASDLTRLLSIEHPIVQGPFGGGLSTPALTAAVSNRGGLGSFGAEHLAPDAIVAKAAEITALTSKPYNLNLWVNVYDPGGLEIDEAEFERLWRLFQPAFEELGVEKPQRPERYHQAFEDQVEALLGIAPPVFSFVFGIPAPAILAECRRKGIIAVGAATTLSEALALEAAGVDAVVATGFEAGGHRVSFLAPAEESLMGTFALSRLAAARLRIPVIAAGGVVDAQGVAAALALGAAAAQLGTAFLATEESGASEAHRQALFSARAERTVLSRAYSGRLGRSVANRWAEEHPAAFAPYPIQNWFTAKLKPAAAKAGRLDHVSIWAGQGAPLLRHKTVGSLMDSLIVPNA